MYKALPYEEQLKEYNRVNNSFKKSVIYHVGIDAGFHSEVDAMMESMLWCYLNKVKFILYADDANFSGGNGWNEFFVPFCEENHDPLNKIGNFRYPVQIHKFRYSILQFLLKIRNHANYLTADVFAKCIPRKYSQNIMVKWPEFDIDGSIFTQFAKLRNIALRFNDKTQDEVNKIIENLNLPENYVSIQCRGGDKVLEVKELMKVDEVLKKIKEHHINIQHLFVFSDDYRYVDELKSKCPAWNIYTLTNKDERGYDNAEFNRLNWEKKRVEMIKMFAAIEICMKSSLHLGYEYSCVNNYIRHSRDQDKYLRVSP